MYLLICGIADDVLLLPAINLNIYTFKIVYNIENIYSSSNAKSG